MTGRVATGVVGLIVVFLLCGDVTRAQAQTLNFTLGRFVPFGEDARTSGDVLLANRNFLAFDVDDFSVATAGAEWLMPVGNFVELGAGASFSRRTVPSVYRDFVGSDNTEIEQRLRLRMIPVAFTVRLVPTGQQSSIQPYIGGGVALINWRYSEFGDFVDFGAPGRPIRPDSFVASGTEAAPVVLGGIRFGAETLSAGGEIRYQRAEGDLDDRFAGPRLDLGGWTYQFTLGIRFGR